MNTWGKSKILSREPARAESGSTYLEAADLVRERPLALSKGRAYSNSQRLADKQAAHAKKESLTVDPVVEESRGRERDDLRSRDDTKAHPAVQVRRCRLGDVAEIGDQTGSSPADPPEGVAMQPLCPFRVETTVGLLVFGLEHSGTASELDLSSGPSREDVIRTDPTMLPSSFRAK